MIPWPTYGTFGESRLNMIMFGGAIDDRYRRERRAARLGSAKSASRPASTSAAQGDSDDDSDWSEIDFDEIDFREEPQLLVKYSDLETPKSEQKVLTLLAVVRTHKGGVRKAVLFGFSRRGNQVVQFLDPWPEPGNSAPSGPPPAPRRPKYTQPSATAADLPVELLPEIATQVMELFGHNRTPTRGQKSVISSMSLVSRTWTNPFRKFLFFHSAIENLNDLHAFAAILDHPPLVGITPVWKLCARVSLVIAEEVLPRPWLHHAFDILNARLLKRNPDVALCLAIFGPGFAGGKAARSPKSIHALLPRSLQPRHYSRFSVIHLQDINFESFAHFVQLLDNIPTLTAVGCSNMIWPMESGRSTKRSRRVWRESPSLSCIQAISCPDAHALFRMLSRKVIEEYFYCVSEREISVMLDLFQTFDIRVRDAASAPSWTYKVLPDFHFFATTSYTTSLDFEVTNAAPDAQRQPTEFVFSTHPHYLADGTYATPANSPLAPYELSIQYIIIKIKKGNVKDIVDLDWPAFRSAVLQLERLDGVMIAFPDPSSWVAFIGKCGEEVMPLWLMGKMSFAVLDVREAKGLGWFAGWWPVEGHYTSSAPPVGYHTMTYDSGLKLLCGKVWAEAPRVDVTGDTKTKHPIMLNYAY